MYTWQQGLGYVPVRHSTGGLTLRSPCRHVPEEHLSPSHSVNGLLDRINGTVPDPLLLSSPVTQASISQPSGSLDQLVEYALLIHERDTLREKVAQLEAVVAAATASPAPTIDQCTQTDVAVADQGTCTEADVMKKKDQGVQTQPITTESGTDAPTMTDGWTDALVTMDSGCDAPTTAEKGTHADYPGMGPVCIDDTFDHLPWWENPINYDLVTLPSTGKRPTTRENSDRKEQKKRPADPLIQLPPRPKKSRRDGKDFNPTK